MSTLLPFLSPQFNLNLTWGVEGIHCTVTARPSANREFQCKHAAGGGVHQPEQFSILRLQQLRRQLVWLKWTFEYRFKRRGFVRPVTMKMMRAALLAAGAVRVMRSVYNLPIQFRTAMRPSACRAWVPGKKRQRVALVAHPGQNGDQSADIRQPSA